MADKPQQPTKTFWSKAGTNSKAGFDKLWGWADKLGAPVNKLSNKLGSESFWPTTLDKESEKAARILQSFCKDGFYEEELQAPAEGGPKQKQKVIKKIPVEVIQKAKGLAIFTTMRTGLWISGAGGSGVLVARKEDGNWGPPVGIMLHTAGLGFLVGVDIYDCVLVLNTDKAVEAFSKWRATVGGEISAVAGPAGIGGVLDSELNKRASPIFAYLKSRGFYAGVQVDGTVIIERVDENERFYGQKLPAMDILMGKVQPRERELEMLMETLKAAQGDKNVRSSLLPNEPAPADYEVVESDHRFGVPDKEDPDPYGVLALENAAEVHEIHEARAPQAIQARMVSVPKRMTPQLPSRNPGRMRSAQSISSHQQSETSSLHSIAASNTDADGFTSHDSHRRSSVTSNPPSPGKSTSLRSVASEVQVAHAKPAEDELEVKPEPVTVPETAELMPGGFPEPASPPALPSRSVQREKSPAVVAGNDTTEQKKETEKDTEEVEATRGEKTEEKVEQKAEETKSPSPLSRGRSLTRAESPAKDHRKSESPPSRRTE
ncbi:hypothetical protein FH972_025216 [Carpinus fangiana]|uniref:Ysc84 actin-binding domain-containing protein n=1 Tax=Carpinus fangiana TaxID=176857 RepID=A0A5N6L0D0_9ROSI|nr:hypothetical protein FH972_025216 [Carpinus fangiana]